MNRYHSDADMGEHIVFSFKDPNGYIELKFDAPQKKPTTGWTIEPHKQPCKVYEYHNSIANGIMCISLCS